MRFSTASKVISYSRAVEIAHDRKGSSLVITNGCFDLLHAGHVSYLEDCRAEGDYLMVGVNSDWAVKALKGPTRPLNKIQDRMRVLAALACVDLVCPIDDTTVAGFISDMRAKYWIKGGDYTPETLNQDEVKEATRAGTMILIKPIVAGISTTSILSRV